MREILFFVFLALMGRINAQVCYSPASMYGVSGAMEVINVAIADFNADGKPDAVASDDSRITVLLGDGVGNLSQPGTSYVVGGYSSGDIVCKDFNGDGKMDIATAAAYVKVLLGNGNGTFGSAITTSVYGYIENTLNSGDFNNDSKPDLAVIYNNPLSTTNDSLGIWLGTGTGDFTFAQKMPLPKYGSDIEVRDFNGDGNADLAVTIFGSANNVVSVYLGNGTGTFGANTDFGTFNEPLSLVSADFNGDTKFDLAVADYNSNRISLFTGTGTGSFNAPVIFTTDSFPENITSADLNNDGKADLMMVNGQGVYAISVLLGNGAGGFSPHLSFTENAYRDVATADFNSDGKLDFISGNGNYYGSLSLVLNGPITTTITSSSYSVCPSTSVTLTAAGAMNYTWTSSAGSSNANPYAVSLTSPTTFTLHGAVGTCTSVATYSVGVFPPATASIGASIGSHICLGSSENLGAGGITSYTWSANAGGSHNSYVTISPTVATTYSVSGTNNNGCYGSASYTVYIDTTVNVTISGVTNYCSGSTTTLTANAPSATSYTWNIGGFGYTTPTVTVGLGTTSICTVEATTGACISSNTVQVNVTPTPTLAVSASSPTLCSGQNDILTASGGATYTWSANAGSANTNTVSVSPGTTTVYSVSSINAGCGTTYTFSLPVTTTPTVNVVGSSSVCLGATLTLTTSGATTYTWMPGSLHTGTVSVSPASNTTYTLTGQNGNCYGTSVFPVQVNTIVPVVTISGNSNVNGGEITVLTATGGSSYTWSPGTYVSPTNTIYPVITTVYTVTGTNGICNGNTTVTLTVNNPQLISLVAGSSTGFAGDGGPATSAKLNSPWQTAFDASGNLYIADYSNHRIRRVTSSGIITTIAGTGTASWSGDGGQAALATLNYPSGVAVDHSGNIYIADRLNNVVRQINPFGIISTFAGYGAPGYSGDGGPATSAMLNWPTSVTVDKNDNLYITDYHGHRVRKVNIATGIITTIAGDGLQGYPVSGSVATAAHLNGPSGVAVGPSGNIYISNRDGDVISKVDPNGIITNIAYDASSSGGYNGDGGLGTNTELYFPTGIAVDNFENIYFADIGNGYVRRINSWGTVTGIAGYGGGSYGTPAFSAYTGSPVSVTLDSIGNLYVSAGAIKKITNCVSPLSFTVSGNTSLCAGDTAFLNASGAVNYVWYSNSGTSSGSNVNFNPTTDEIVSVSSYSNGCISNKFISLSVDSCVWPGDADENLVADNNDLLILGLEYGKTGPSRTVQGNTWQGHMSSDWTDTLSNGKNIKYADCNGDGTIDMNDTLAININYGLTHTARNGQQIIQSSNADVYLQFDKTQYLPGDTVNASVLIGRNANPQTNFYGASFNINYDNSKVQSGTEKFWFNNSWVGNINQSKIKLSKINSGVGVVDVSLVRITHTDTGGFGKVGTLQFVLKTGLSSSQLYLTIINAIKINSAGNPSSLSSGTDTANVVSGTTDILLAVNSKQLSVYPNPSTNKITIQSSAELGTIIVYNSLGEIALQTTSKNSQEQLDISKLPAGMYFVEAKDSRIKLIKN